MKDILYFGSKKFHQT